MDITGRINRATGRREGGILGLTSGQTDAVIRARRELENLDSNYFTRKRRDARFDGLVRKAIKAGKPLSQADIDRVTGRYKDRLLKYRGEVIARTETLAALQSGKVEGIQQLIDAGKLRADQVTKRWRATGDARTRDSHAAMNDQRVGFNAAFVTPSGFHMAHPHDSSLGAPASETIQCRCLMEFKIDYMNKIAPKQRPAPDAPAGPDGIMANRDITHYAEVLEKGRATNTEHLSAYDKAGGATFKSVGDSHNVSFSDELQAALSKPSSNITVHHNHPSSRTLSRQDLEMIGLFPGLKTVYAHGHDGGIFKAERVKSFGPTDLDKVNNDVARPFIRFEKRFASNDDRILLFQHAFVKRAEQKGFIKYQISKSGRVHDAYVRNKEIFDAIMGAL